MEYKTDDLIGSLLDAAVAKAEGLQYRVLEEVDSPLGRRLTVAWLPHLETTISSAEEYEPSTDWAAGGPIIEREQISVQTGYMERLIEWEAVVGDAFSGNWPTEEPISRGPTPLVAAMRAYVTSKLGQSVDLP
jgi:hypothetical protein